MSSVYATEPTPTGRVILETTHGPIDMQLWCRECPETTRLFLQLCRDGYYQGMIFHRIVPHTLIQTGIIRRSTATGGTVTTETMHTESWDRYRSMVRADYALERQRYEIHSRIKFNHRGQVAMALATTTTQNQQTNPHDRVDGVDAPEMQCQFFITLTDMDHLNGQHVVFGTVTGPTFFNVLRIGRTVGDDEDALNTVLPTSKDGTGTGSFVDLNDAPQILSVKILNNPLEEKYVSLSQSKIPWTDDNTNNKRTTTTTSTAATARKKNERKGQRNLNLLSFANDDEEEENGEGSQGGDDHDAAPSKHLPRMQSSHDVLPSNRKRQGRRTGANDDDDNHNSEETERTYQTGDTSDNDKNRTNTNHNNKASDEEEETEIRLPTTQLAKNDDLMSDRGNIPPITETSAGLHNNQQGEDQHSFSNHNQNVHTSPSTTLETQRHIPQIDTTQQPLPAPVAAVATTTSTNSLVEARRARYIKGYSNKKEREEKTLEKLHAFQNRMRHLSAPLSADETAENTGTNDTTSLASRMAERAKQEEAMREGGVRTTIPTYHGQILENERGEDSQPAKWLQTKFKCKKHVDHLAQEGGDGRSMDDYEVIDDRRHRGSHSKEGTRKRHKHNRHDRGHRSGER